MQRVLSLKSGLERLKTPRAFGIGGAVVALLCASAGETLGEQPAPELLWRAGSALAAAPAIGPDGAVYIAGRQGTLDVLEASGNHRFSVTLGGAPTGALFVDERGWAYIGLATGRLLGITPTGQKFFAYQSPSGIRRGVGFATGQGLLILGYDGAVIGVNRGGFPTMRMSVLGGAAAGPVGIGGWCVVGTATGDLVWGDRWGKRHLASVGAVPRDLRPTVDGGLWALADTTLSQFSAKRVLVFERDATLAMATAPRSLSPNRIQGARLTTDLELEWLDADGRRIALRRLDANARPSSAAALQVDQEGWVWLTEVGRLRAFGPRGQDEPVREFRGRDLFSPVFDGARRRSIVSTVDGEVFRIDWQQRELLQAYGG